VDNYEEEMLKAFVNKPEKYEWYKKSFSKYDVNGVTKMAWNWSWWSFFGGAAFLLYRKAYLAALVVFVLSVITAIIPLVSLIIAIFVGGYGTYFIYKKYLKKKLEIEATISDKQVRIETMKKIGGYNQWVIWVYYAFAVLVLVGMIAAIIIPKLSSM